jgi:hypothetical protein
MSFMRENLGNTLHTQEKALPKLSKNINGYYTRGLLTS